MNKKLTGFIIFLFLTLVIWIPTAIKLPIFPMIFGMLTLAYSFGFISLIFLGLYLKQLIETRKSQ